MEFIKLTFAHDREEVYINTSHIIAVKERDGGSFVHAIGGDSYAVRESQDYIAQHLYVCNKSYVNTQKGE